MSKSGYKRLGPGDKARGAALIGVYAAGEIGKTRLAAAACRACPEWFGQRAIYVAIDPEAAEMGSVLLQKRVPPCGPRRLPPCARPLRGRAPIGVRAG